MLLTFGLFVAAPAFVVGGLYFGLPHLLQFEDLATSDVGREIDTEGAKLALQESALKRRAAAA